MRRELYRRGRLMYSSWLRATRWEYWPPWLAYLPVAGQIAALAIRHRSLTVFTAANPAIVAGGVVGESKAEILNGLCESSDRVARSLLLPGALPGPSKRARVVAFMAEHELNLPIVLKPNEGQRGSGVVVARSREALDAYLARCVVDTIVQEFVPGEEFGVFYYRRPSEARGQILSITVKRLPVVTGDGHKTLERLILDDPQTIGMARFHLSRNRARWNEVPAAGQVVPLGDLGTHCRGARFFDGRALRTEALVEVFDRISRAYAGFYFGRFDVRAASAADLMRGCGFKIVELNGVTSEATHIYDPAIGLPEAYRVLGEQWRLAFEIGAENARRGATVTPVPALVRLLVRHRQTARGHLQPVTQS